VLHWIGADAWPKVRTTERYWLACRFEHAGWLALCLLVPEPDGRSRYLPIRAGALPPGLLSWLLVETWAEAGADRFLNDCGKE